MCYSAIGYTSVCSFAEGYVSECHSVSFILYMSFCLCHSKHVILICHSDASFSDGQYAKLLVRRHDFRQNNINLSTSRRVVLIATFIRMLYFMICQMLML
jgi:hypothetical protein